MFIRILNSEMELATGCTEPGAVALTAAEAGQALRKAGVDKAEEITVNASINIIKNAMSAGIPGTDYEGMDYAAAIGALGGDPVYLLEVMNHVPRETVEAAAALVKAGDTGKPDDGDKPSAGKPNDKGNGLSKTGASVAVIGVAMLLLAAAGFVTVNVVRRRR